MANTLKFGNGNWATKDGSTLAYNDESGFNPLPFDFTRASSATVVNKNGLIETVASGIPRIDFLGNTKGALLLEPQRTNLITYSSDFSDSSWAKIASSVASGFTSPDGTNNATLLSATGLTSDRIQDNLGDVSGATTYSVYAKGNGVSTRLNLQSNDVGGITVSISSSGVMSLFSQGTNTSYLVEEVSNGWYRISFSFVASSGVTNYFQIYPDSQNGTSGVYIYGAQVEAGSYATSIINTSGSAVTREADLCNQNPPSSVIGQTEGTLYCETTKWVASNNGRFIALSDGTSNNYVIIIQNVNYSNFAVYIIVGGVMQVQYTATNSIKNNSKIAVGYINNNVSISVNGTIVHTDTNAAIPNNIDKIYIGSRENSSSTFYSSNPLADVKIYNERLDNNSLNNLTI